MPTPITTATVQPLQSLPSAEEVIGHWDWSPALGTLHEWIQSQGIHASQVVVLVPFAQMMSQATAAWGQAFPTSFVPRFETTRNWAGAAGGPAIQADDLTLDVAHDSVVAAAMLASVKIRGLDAHWRRTLAPQLVETAHELATLVASVHPDARSDWLAERLAVLNLGSGDGFQRWESLIGTMALTWAANSQYPTDVLWHPVLHPSVAALAAIPGLADDPLTSALLAHWPNVKRLPPLAVRTAENGSPNPARLLAADDAQTEAQMAAARVIAHLQAGRVPVGIVAQDRLLTKRIHAHLQTAGVDWRDETGWRLSTTRIAAWAMQWLAAAAPDAPADALVDFVKLCPCWQDRETGAFEADIRALRARQARVALTHEKVTQLDGLAKLLAMAQRPKTFDDWRQTTLDALDLAGLWRSGDCPEDIAQLLHVLRADSAGADSARSLQLLPWPVAQAADWAQLSRNRFVAWLRGALEAHSYKPTYVGRVEVVALPMPQLYGRELGAVVLAGCDAVHLPAQVANASIWTPAQRTALGLESAEEATQRAYDAWCLTLQFPQHDIFWRQTDGDQVMQPAPWLSLLTTGTAHDERPTRWSVMRPVVDSKDERHTRSMTHTPTQTPATPMGTVLPTRLSASAYQALRDCPYRFFTHYGLRLREVEELALPPGARDFGNWIHRTLAAFHVGGGQLSHSTTRAVLEETLSQCAQAALPSTLAEDADFLPYLASWPALRDGYLDWLHAHEANGFSVDSHETPIERVIAEDTGLTLFGTVDRIDTGTDAEGKRTFALIDYKTEHPDKTRARVSSNSEDTQLPFYAAIHAPRRRGSDTSVEASYLNLGSRPDSKAKGRLTQTMTLAAVDEQAEQLVTQITHDWQRLQAGTAVKALGEGDVCTHCAARGLCRKAYWDL